MRYSQLEIKKLVEEQERSGMPVPEFCRARGIGKGTFYVWKQRVRQSANRFARVETEERVEVELPGGALLRVPLSNLKAVVEALR